MPISIVPKERIFYQLFSRDIATIVEGTRALQDLLADFKDVPAKEQRIVELEHEGDETTHEIIRTVNRTFVTPLDREDIYALTTEMDDILDLAQAVADALTLYHIETVRPEAQQMAGVLVRATEELQRALGKLESLKGMEAHFIEIHRLENEGDRVFRGALGALFENARDPIDVIKWKDIFELLEMAIDRCEDVANVLESIMIKNA